MAFSGNPPHLLRATPASVGAPPWPAPGSSPDGLLNPVLQLQSPLQRLSATPVDSDVRQGGTALQGVGVMPSMSTGTLMMPPAMFSAGGMLPSYTPGPVQILTTHARLGPRDSEPSAPAIPMMPGLVSNPKSPVAAASPPAPVTSAPVVASAAVPAADNVEAEPVKVAEKEEEDEEEFKPQYDPHESREVAQRKLDIAAALAAASNPVSATLTAAKTIIATGEDIEDPSEPMDDTSPDMDIVPLQETVDVWAQCSACEKWHVLPEGWVAEDLPDKFTCEMAPIYGECDPAPSSPLSLIHI